jgi:cellulose synthase operon protein C
MGRGAWAGRAGLLLVAIGGAPDGPPRGGAPIALEVEFSGCSAVLAGPVCELPDDGALRIWVKAEEGARTAIAIDGRAIMTEATPIQGGALHRARVPAGARSLWVRAVRGGGEALFRLPLGAAMEAPILKKAEALRKQDKLAEAEALLVGLAGDPDARVRALAIGGLGRIDLARGNTEAAFTRLREAMRLHEAGGRISEERHDGLALFYALLYNGRRFGEAREVLASLKRLGGDHEGGDVTAAYYEGLLAYETGDLRTALRLVRRSEEAAERLGMDGNRIAYLQEEATVLQALGRDAEARAALLEAARLLPPNASPCKRADLLTNLGWNLLQDHGAAAGARALDPLEKALALGCPDRWSVANTLTNVALAELGRGHLDEARRSLEKARISHPDPDARIAVWWLDVEGRIALQLGEAEDALGAYERLAELASAAVLPVARWRAALGRAQALEALGRIELARAAYAEAERLLEDHSLLVPIDNGKESFLARFEEGARLRVDFLIDRAPAEAAAAARRARARALGALQWIDRLGALSPAERDRWDTAIAGYRREREAIDAEAAAARKLPADEVERSVAQRRERGAALAAELDAAIAAIGRPDTVERAGVDLPSPARGELFLIYYPVRRGWAGFAIREGETIARRIPDLDPAATAADLARASLDPFRDALAAARKVRFLPYGEIEAIDFHALPWNGEPLLAAVPVEYGADLPARSRSATSPPVSRALIVDDPRGDLPEARREAAAVGHVVGAWAGWQEESIEGARATHREVREALESRETRLFHYAGHGFFGGRDGWESGLPLGEDGWLTVSDILTLPRAPAEIVLSGCDTARRAGARVEGIGIGQAFLLAGSTSVVAATRPVADRLAARLMSAFYEASPGPAPAAALGAAERLRAAQLALRREEPGSDWASFRTLVP